MANNENKKNNDDERLKIGRDLITEIGGYLENKNGVLGKNCSIDKNEAVCWVMNENYFKLRITSTDSIDTQEVPLYVKKRFQNNKLEKERFFVIGKFIDTQTYVIEEFENLTAKIKKIEKDAGKSKSELIEKIKEVLGLMLMKKQLEDIIESGNKQIIFTGAPGTGKTYTARKHLEEEGKKQHEGYEFIQFHSSYDYTDFVEGLRPVRIKDEKDNENTTFVRMDGVFKEFCRKIVEAELEEIYKKSGNGSYQELEPQKKRELLEIYETEEEKLDNNYYFIIDEINRADLSKVFGELMFGLEESYRGISNRFPTQYKNLKTYEIKKGGYAYEMKFDCFEEGFFVPKNLIIIGTMNDIDRSVEAFDFALRRRFRWVEVDANTELKECFENLILNNFNKNGTDGKLKEESENKIKKAVENIENLNEHIAADNGGGKAFNLNKSYQIGHAYFKDYNGDNMDTIWKNRVEPILKEYCRGRDAGKFIEDCKNILLSELEKSGSTK